MYFIARNLRTVKIRCFILTGILFIIYLFLYYIVLEAWFESKSRPIATSPLLLPYIVVHLDLKGAPPKLEYLDQFFALIKKHGANALLIEYEDMFPYDGRLVNLSAKNCYNKAKLKKVLTTASYNGLELIPLVQTFGHMEYVLKLTEFQHLREDPMYSDSICPSKIESRRLIKDMLDQIISFHLSIAPLRYIHVGCDEVFQINKCQQCTKQSLSDLAIYLRQLNEVRDLITTISKETTVLIWDDMLRSVSIAVWNKIGYRFFHNIEPVYWDYDSDLQVTHINLMKYHKKFSNIWVASAYKGADGKTATIPNIRRRFANHYSWLNLIHNYKFGGEVNKFVFKGIILTGWSRYNHMEPVCELLPVAIPSLLLNLLLIKKYNDLFAEDINNLEDAFNYIERDVKEYLECTNPNISNNDFEIFNFAYCNYDGSELNNVLKQYMSAVSNINKELNAIETSTEYNTMRINNNLNFITQRLVWCNNTIKHITDLDNNISKVMDKYFDEHIIIEYVTFKSFNVKKKVYKLMSILQKQIIKRH